MKYYFNSFNILALSKKDTISQMVKNGVTEMIIYEAEKSKGENDLFWCRQYFGCGEKGNCGKLCKHYEPRNKKSGCCKHYGNLYEEGRPYILNVNGKIKKA
jgi:hypothetical protein